PRTQYYLGLAEIEDGKKDVAIKRWKALLASAPADASWRRSVEAELAALENPGLENPGLAGPGPSAEQVGAAAQMSPEARQEMSEGMVSNLAARLEEAPNDLPGWLRLI